MKISKDLLAYLESLGDQRPITTDHILESMPTYEELREIVPLVMPDADLQFALDKCYKLKASEHSTRIRFMLYVNHYVRIRTDDQFLRTESVIAHKNLASGPFGKRVGQVLDMSHAVQVLKENPSTDSYLNFLSWYENSAEGKLYRNGPDGTPIVYFDNEICRWRLTHYENDPRETWYTKTLAMKYARKRFRNIYEALIKEE